MLIYFSSFTFLYSFKLLDLTYRILEVCNSYLRGFNFDPVSSMVERVKLFCDHDDTRYDYANRIECNDCDGVNALRNHKVVHTNSSATRTWLFFVELT